MKIISFLKFKELHLQNSFIVIHLILNSLPMKTYKVLFLFYILACLNYDANAQLFVSPDNFIFVKNEVVFVKQNIELKSETSSIYLRKDAQLVQGTTATSGNKGIGDLSVYQEGTTTNYAYNYWCSPVGAHLEPAGNSAFGVGQLKSINSIDSSSNSIILPVNNPNGVASPLSIASRWIYKFLVSTNYSQWIYVGGNSAINAGEGFTMKGTSGVNTTTVEGVQNNPGANQRYDFRGKPNDGTISIPVQNANLTLTGNPYPSAIDLSAFLNAQANCTGIAYFWEQDKTTTSHNVAAYKGGYGAFSSGALNSKGIYVPATYYSYDGGGNPGSIFSTPLNNLERRFSPIGQGFMIEGNENGTIVEMKNEYRVYIKEGSLNYSEFERNSGNTSAISNIQSVSNFDYTSVNTQPVPQIRFNTLLNNLGIRQLSLGFQSETTDGVDRGFDAKSADDVAPADVYFVLNNNRYVISVLPFSSEKRIAIGFKNTAAANYKITVNEFLNFSDAENVYLYDKISGIYYDIKNSFCELNLPAGTNNTQYEITFFDATLGTANVNYQNFQIFQNNDLKQLTISNPNQIEISKVEIYDVAGKELFLFKTDKTAFQCATSSWSNGIYIVKISSKDGKTTAKKISVSNL
jgi:hypothetical protein